MSNQNAILIRDVPENVTRWIAEEMDRTKMSRQELIIRALIDKSNLCKNELPLRKNIQEAKFKFIDLFAGIGGFRFALEKLGGGCVFSSEWDKYAQKTYAAWFGEVPSGDLRAIDPVSMPDHDILAAGFPCQPFSLAGVSKKKSLGRAHGFKDKKQGNLFFVLADIIEAKRPPVVLLENVKNLTVHDKGRTWSVIKSTLEDRLGYKVYHRIFDAAYWVPQHRERVFIVGFDKKAFGEDPGFKFSEPPKNKKTLVSILEEKPDCKYTLTDNLWSYLQAYAKKHQEKGNGFGFGIADPNGVTRTLSARYHKDGSEILLDQGKGKNPRRLTPKECMKLMGYPKDKEIVVSDTQAYRQFGNGVVVPVVEHVAKSIIPILEQRKQKIQKKT